MYSACRIMHMELAAIRDAYGKAPGEKDQRLRILASQTARAAEVAAKTVEGADHAQSQDLPR